MSIFVASSTEVDISANRTCSRSTISPTRMPFQSLPLNSSLSFSALGGLFNNSCNAAWLKLVLGCLCTILGEEGLALRFSAKLARWPIDGLDGVRERPSLVEGVRAMFVLDEKGDGLLVFVGGGDEA